MISDNANKDRIFLFGKNSHVSMVYYKTMPNEEKLYMDENFVAQKKSAR